MSEHLDDDQPKNADWTPYASAGPWYLPGYREEIRSWREAVRQARPGRFGRALGGLCAAFAGLVSRRAPQDMARRIPAEQAALDARVPASETTEVTDRR